MTTAVLIVYGDPLTEFEPLRTEVHFCTDPAWSGSQVAGLLSARMPEPGELDDTEMVRARAQSVAASAEAMLVEAEPYELATAVSVAGNLMRPVYDASYSDQIGLGLVCDLDLLAGGEIDWFGVRPHPMTDPSAVRLSEPVVRGDRMVIDPAALASGRHRVSTAADGSYVCLDAFGRRVRAPEAADWELSAAAAKAAGGRRSPVVVVVSVDTDRGVRGQCWLLESVTSGFFGTGNGGLEVASGEFDQLERVAGGQSAWVTAGGANHRVLLVEAVHTDPDSQGRVRIDPLSAASFSGVGRLRVDGVGDGLKLTGELASGPADPAAAPTTGVSAQVLDRHARLRGSLSSSAGAEGLLPRREARCGFDNLG